MRAFVLPAIMLAALSLAGCGEPKPDKVFGAKVRTYLLEHPEVLREVSAKLAEKEAAEANSKISEALAKNRKAIERDPRDFVANPNGKVTVTEFYDYRCPHCVNVAPAVLEIARTRPDVRVVFKEMPIFGAESEHAAFAALMTKARGGDYLAVHEAMMAARPLDADAINRILRAHGQNPADLEAFAAKNASHLRDIRQLAGQIGVEGTPAFIVGDQLIPGENLTALEEAIAKARTKGG